jgi:two-component system sensor histidine kinase DesK
MLLIAVALTLGDRRDWIELFIFVTVSIGPSFRPVRALQGVALMVLLAPALGLMVGAGILLIAQMMFQSAISGVAVIIVTRTIVLDRELRLARGEIARLAVNEERLRLARDLHDLLGHSLSMIALKSELAARLAITAPERAASEMRDVESAARSALREVRDTVAGYRRPTLAAELESARAVLTAAGIDCEIQGEAEPIAGEPEAALAWAVREGVTNVVKHSRAAHCTIHLHREDGTVALEVLDDGRGALDGGRGSGLAGLAERVAALGGRCEAGMTPAGGFRLAVTVPTGERAAAEILRPA